MFKRPGAGRLRSVLLVALGGLVLASHASAAVVGQFSGNSSGSIWASSGNFSTIYGAALAATPSHTVEAPEQISAASLANNSHFIIANPVATVSDMAALVNWVNAGGILMLFVDGSAPGQSIGIVNSILSSLGTGFSGTTMQVGPDQLLPSYITSQLTAAALAGFDPAVGALGGQSVAMFNPYGITGGSTLAINLLGSALRVDHYSLGKVYVFGDAFSSNQNIAHPSGLTNQYFFLNLLAQGTNGGGGGGTGPLDAPEPGTLGLLTVGALGLLWRSRRHKA